MSRGGNAAYQRFRHWKVVIWYERAPILVFYAAKYQHQRYLLPFWFVFMLCKKVSLKFATVCYVSEILRRRRRQHCRRRANTSRKSSSILLVIILSLYSNTNLLPSHVNFETKCYFRFKFSDPVSIPSGRFSAVALTSWPAAICVHAPQIKFTEINLNFAVNKCRSLAHGWGQDQG